MALTEPILDLVVLPTSNAKTLAVGDASLYPSSFNKVSPTLQIKIPGFPEASLAFVPGGLQVYNSLSLGLSCEDQCLSPLPDGLYRFVYSLTPAYTYHCERYWMKLDQLQEKWDHALLKLDILQCDKNIKAADLALLRDIRQMMEGAISAANQCVQKLALDCYQRASRLLDQFLQARNY